MGDILRFPPFLGETLSASVRSLTDLRYIQKLTSCVIIDGRTSILPKSTLTGS
jgi:hypothetical protein